MRRFFSKEIDGDRVELAGSEASHISRVLRMQVGDELVLFDGSGFDYLSRIESIDANHVILYVQDKVLADTEPASNITLCQAVIKNNHFELAVEKATELGVKNFVPFISKRCVRRPRSESRFLERVERTVLEAAKQCGRSYLPRVENIHSFEELSETCSHSFTLLAYEGESAQTIKQCLQAEKQQDVLIVVGPEGGFTKEEVDQLKESGACSVSLGKLILRAETAGPVAAAMVLYEWEDWT